MTHLPLFAGFNGFGLASDAMGWEQPCHCEVDKFCQTIIQYYWPNSIPYYDIRQTDFSIWRGKIDVLTGGFPCQPYSVAGKQLGKEDDRHLWPEMLRAIREVKPTWVVGENVSGLVSWNGGMVFDEVQADLEAEGYEVQPFLLPAAGVGAPHRRYRIWFIAYSESKRGSKRDRKEIDSSERENSEHIAERSEIRDWDKAVSGAGILTNSTNARIEAMCESEKHTDRSETFTNPQKSNKQRDRICKACAQREIGGCNCKSNVTNTNSGRQSSKEYRKKKSGFFTEKSILGDWENFPTQSPICGGNDGIPTELYGITFPKWRNESIKGYGNAIVPQVALQIFKAIEQYIKES